MFIQLLNKSRYPHWILRHSIRQGKNKFQKLNVLSLSRWLISEEISPLQDRLRLRRKMFDTPDRLEDFNRELVYFILDTHRAALGRSGQFAETDLDDYGEKQNKQLESELIALRKRLEACLALPAWRVGQSYALRPQNRTVNPVALLKSLEIRTRNAIIQRIDLSKFQRNDLDNYDNYDDEPAKPKSRYQESDYDPDATGDLPAYPETIRHNPFAPTETYFGEKLSDAEWDR